MSGNCAHKWMNMNLIISLSHILSPHKLSIAGKKNRFHLSFPEFLFETSSTELFFSARHDLRIHYIIYTQHKVYYLYQQMHNICIYIYIQLLYTQVLLYISVYPHHLHGIVYFYFATIFHGT